MPALLQNGAIRDLRTLVVGFHLRLRSLSTPFRENNSILARNHLPGILSQFATQNRKFDMIFCKCVAKTLCEAREPCYGYNLRVELVPQTRRVK